MTLSLDERWRAEDREARRLGEEQVAQEQREQAERERAQSAQRERSAEICKRVKPEHDAAVQRMAKAARELQTAISQYRGFLLALAEDNVFIGDRLNVVFVSDDLDPRLAWLVEQIEAAK